MSVTTHSVKLDGFHMDYFRFGRGPQTLVILPGLSVQCVMGAAEAVAEAYKALEEDFTIYVFDRRAELPPIYRIEDMARDTARAFQALGLRETCLFGASQGGMIALAMAIEYPELAGRLALGSTTSHVTEAQYRVLASWAELAKKGDRLGLYLAFGREIYPPQVFRQYREALAAAAETVTDQELERFIILTEGMKDFNLSEQVGRIRCPVLAIGAFEDSVLDSDATMEIAERLDHRPDFRLYMYTGFGHAAFDTAPDYRERLLRFFRQGEPGKD